MYYDVNVCRLYKLITITNKQFVCHCGGYACAILDNKLIVIGISSLVRVFYGITSGGMTRRGLFNKSRGVTGNDIKNAENHLFPFIENR